MKMNEKNDSATTSVQVPQHHMSLIENLAEKLGGTAAVRTVYGDAVTCRGVTVIPVAKVAYAFGGGAGASEQGNGEGGGGGVSATPVGYIEIRDGETSFRRILDSMALASLIVAGGVAGALMVRGIYRLRSLKGGDS